MMIEQTTEVHTKFRHLQQVLRELGRVLVAFSGGVDSTFLLKAALETLGRENVLAVIAASPSFPESEMAEARDLAESLGARYQVIRSEEMQDPHFVANPSNRCYYCKSDLFSRLTAMSRQDGYAAVVDGANADDRGDWRPGSQAACEQGVRSPLQEAGLTKADIRALSRDYRLSTWDKPSMACLASRIPYGSAITVEALSHIERAEQALHALGFRQVRVRHHGEVARIELPPDDIARLLDPHLREQVTAQLREIGYRYITADLLGYRTGSMNEVL